MKRGTKDYVNLICSKYSEGIKKIVTDVFSDCRDRSALLEQIII